MRASPLLLIAVIALLLLGGGALFVLWSASSPTTGPGSASTGPRGETSQPGAEGASVRTDGGRSAPDEERHRVERDRGTASRAGGDGTVTRGATGRGDDDDDGEDGTGPSPGSTPDGTTLARLIAAPAPPELEGVADWDPGVSESAVATGPLRVEVRAYAHESLAPLADARVIVEFGDGARVSGVTNAHGRAAFPHPGEGGEAWVRIEHAGRIAIIDDDAVVPATASAVFEARMRAGVPLVGRVTSAETGVGIADAEILVLGHWAADDPLTPVKDIHVAGRATSGPDGRYELHAVVPSAFETARISAVGRASVGRRISIPALADGPLVLDVALAAGATAAGRVLAPEGRAAPGALVVAIPATFEDESDAQPAEVHLLRSLFDLSVEIPVLHAFADRSAAFELRGLRRDTAYVCFAVAEDLGCSLATEIDAGGAPAVPVPELRLRRPAHVVVHVVDTSGQPVSGADVMLDPGWRVLFETDGDGVLSCDLVDPGPRRGRVEVAGHTDTPIRFEALPGRTTELTVTVGGGVGLAGRVVDGDGNPIHGAMVTVSRTGASREDRVWIPVGTDTDGRFEVEGLAPGVYDVDVEHRRHVEKEIEDLEVPAGDLTITLEAAARVRFELELPEGAPEPTQTAVMIERTNASGGARHWWWLGRVFESWSRVVTRRSVPAGPQRLLVVVPGYRNIVLEADLVAGEVHDFGTRGLRPPFELAALVLGEGGAPVSGARVLLSSDVHLDAAGNLRGAEDDSGAPPASGTDGRVTFRTADPEPQPLAAVATGYAVAFRTFTPADDAPPVRIALRRGSLVTLRLRPADVENDGNGGALDGTDRWLVLRPAADGAAGGAAKRGRIVIEPDGRQSATVRLVPGEYEWRTNEMDAPALVHVADTPEQTVELAVPAEEE